MSNKWVWIGVAAAVGWYLVEQRRRADRIAAYERMTADYYKANPGLRTAPQCNCARTPAVNGSGLNVGMSIPPAPIIVRVPAVNIGSL
jgi:hypothetical protein